jgi:hypothetical protein
MPGTRKKASNQGKVKTPPPPAKKRFDPERFKSGNANKLLGLSLVLFCLLLFSVFKNISYPLFWADEGMTAMGTERVLQFGYPKVHDGKNVFYDLSHTNPSLGINPKDDAYIGGAGWGQYYYGTIGYKLAEKTNDLYAKTGIFRSSFAVAGILSLLVVCFFFSRFFPDKFSRYAFFALFMLFELCSVSLVLLLRDARYYSLVMLLASLIIGMYSWHKFYKPIHTIIFVPFTAAALWMMFVTLSPVYFILLAAVGLSESVIFLHQTYKLGFASSLRKSLPVFLSLAISFIGIIPLLSYFRTFEISRAISDFLGFNATVYFTNLSAVFTYFTKFEFLYLAVALKILLSFNARKLFREMPASFRVSNFLSALFVISLFAICRIPRFIFTRYIIFLQPLLVVIIILDLFLLLEQFSQKTNGKKNPLLSIPVAVFAVLFIFTLGGNFRFIKGHLYEMFNRYQGPLDYTIPYIQKNFPATDTLVIAASYEEASYMYYLKSKVIVGFVGNNLKEDSLMTPHILAYRKAWGNFPDVFNGFLRRSAYMKIGFPVFDDFVNTIPELNCNAPELNHHFRSTPAETGKDAVYLYVKKP